MIKNSPTVLNESSSPNTEIGARRASNTSVFTMESFKEFGRRMRGTSNDDAVSSIINIKLYGKIANSEESGLFADTLFWSSLLIKMEHIMQAQPFSETDASLLRALVMARDAEIGIVGRAFDPMASTLEQEKFVYAIREVIEDLKIVNMATVKLPKSRDVRFDVANYSTGSSPLPSPTYLNQSPILRDNSPIPSPAIRERTVSLSGQGDSNQGSPIYKYGPPLPPR